MVINEMSREECLQMLAGARLARLGCAQNNQPYVVPVYLAYDVLPGGEPCLYGFTTLGQKVEWMRANPFVCIEVDDVAAYDQWVSVVAFGRFEELHDTPEHDGEQHRAHQVFQVGRYEGPDTPGHDQRILAHKVLQAQAMWWEPACTARSASEQRDPAEPYAPVYYRVHIDRVTGHRATPDPQLVPLPAAPVRKLGWLLRARRLGPDAPPLPSRSK
ncbi:MAG: pyridoxamine 5'-phosphate oxidase family protein [Isosphaerales bacterium]